MTGTVTLIYAHVLGTIVSKMDKRLNNKSSGIVHADYEVMYKRYRNRLPIKCMYQQ